MGDEGQMDEFSQRLLNQELADSPAQKDFRLVQWQLDQSDVIEELKHYLRGDEEVIEKLADGTEQIVWKANPEFRKMNEAGVREMAAFIRNANKNVFLSNLNEFDIGVLMTEFHITMINHLAMNWRKWEIEKRDLSGIMLHFIMTIYPALKRAQAGGERKGVYGSQKFLESSVTHVQPQQKSGGGFFSIFRRNR